MFKSLFAITLISPIILILGIAIGIYCRKHLTGCFRLLLLYLILGFVTEVMSKYFGSFSNLKYNLFLIPIYALLELLLFSILYYKHVVKSKNRYFLYFIFVLLGLILIDLSRIGSMFNASSFQSYGKVIADAGIVIFCLIYYLDVVKGKIKPTFELNVLNAASLIFFSLNLIIFLAINFLVNAN